MLKPRNMLLGIMAASFGAIPLALLMYEFYTNSTMRLTMIVVIVPIVAAIGFARWYRVKYNHIHL